MVWELIYPASWGELQVQEVEIADKEEIGLVVTCLSAETVVEQDTSPVCVISSLTLSVSVDIQISEILLARV